MSRFCRVAYSEFRSFPSVTCLGNFPPSLSDVMVFFLFCHFVRVKKKCAFTTFSITPRRLF